LGLVSIRQTLELQNITENNEKIEIVHKAINSLPLKQRVPIIMYYFESYNCEEIAEIMKCSTGTVKSRLFYARMELKEKLKPFLEDDGWIEVST
jgi:RNA polymerase sigma-70 factor (ECF subfamily)